MPTNEQAAKKYELETAHRTVIAEVAPQRGYCANCIHYSERLQYCGIYNKAMAPGYGCAAYTRRIDADSDAGRYRLGFS